MRTLCRKNSINVKLNLDKMSKRKGKLEGWELEVNSELLQLYSWGRYTPATLERRSCLTPKALGASGEAFLIKPRAHCQEEERESRTRSSTKVTMQQESKRGDVWNRSK